MVMDQTQGAESFLNTASSKALPAMACISGIYARRPCLTTSEGNPEVPTSRRIERTPASVIKNKQPPSLTLGGKSHHIEDIPTVLERKKNKPTVLEEYDAAADAKKRISLRRPKTKYFRVRALSNGAYLLEPRVLVSPQVLSDRVLKMLDQSAKNLKKGNASPPIDLTPFREK